MYIKQQNNPHRLSVLEKTRVQILKTNSIRVPVLLRKASIYKGLPGLGSTSRPPKCIIYYKPDIVTKNTRVRK